MADYLDSELDLRIEAMLALDCHPKHFLPKDVINIIGKSEEEVKALNIQKHYASEIAGIKTNEIPPYEALNKTPNKITAADTKQFTEFGIKISNLLDMDDTCDKQGIKFIAKLFSHYYPNKEQFDTLNPHIRSYIMAVLSYEAKIVSLAKKAVNID